MPVHTYLRQFAKSTHRSTQNIQDSARIQPRFRSVDYELLAGQRIARRPVSIILSIDLAVGPADHGAKCASGEDPAYHFSIDVCEPEIPAGVAISQFFVIDAHQMQNSGMQVVYMHSILD